MPVTGRASSPGCPWLSRKQQKRSVAKKQQPFSRSRKT